VHTYLKMAQLCFVNLNLLTESSILKIIENMKISIFSLIVFLYHSSLFGQNFAFDFNGSGRRVCLVSSEVNLINLNVKLIFHDSISNTAEPLFVNRRVLGTQVWSNVASNLPAGTGHWYDLNVSLGDVWEYQVKRENTWSYGGNDYDATGYTIGAVSNNNSNYKGQMILLVANDVPTSLSAKYNRLKKEITADGWYINELIVPRASNWNSGNEVVTIKNQIVSIFNSAPSNDKPKTIFIFGHVPLPRCGSADVVAPDTHAENQGARGCDAYFADIDGNYTDVATFNPGGLTSPLQINLPGDFKWDQDFFPSDIEMSFGRIDFADLTEFPLTEMTLLENYLDRLSNYKNVAAGFDMGDKSGFFFGYDNSNDASFRSLLNISKPDKVFENVDPSVNQWVQANGPFKVFMQNKWVPDAGSWQNQGMDATVFTGDQSYWGFGDVPQVAGFDSRIRNLLGAETKCLVVLWLTTGLNIFHQACAGQAFGVSMKEIMNHNEINQYLEKPVQGYDEQVWWNRTHFAFYGDPTMNLYQVSPASNLTVTVLNGSGQLNWSASNDIGVLGYTVLVSDSEFGIYQPITTNPVSGSSYVLPNYQFGKWYMVKAVKMMESGCGKFLHAGLGISIEADLPLSISNENSEQKLNIFPNPSSELFYINAHQQIKKYEVINSLGMQIHSAENLNQTDFSIDCQTWSEGFYFLKTTDIVGVTQLVKLVKRN